MRAASIMIAQPIALSVAPVAECHESRWPPSITTSSFLSVPGISAIVLYGGSPFRIGAIDDVELELDRRAVGEDARDAAVVLVAHDDGRHRLGRGRRSVVERDDLAVLAARVVDANERAVVDEELVDLRPRSRAPGSRRAVASAGRGRRVRRGRAVRRSDCSDRTAPSRPRRRSASPAASGSPARTAVCRPARSRRDLVLHGVEIRRQLLSRRLVRESRC